jgi:hypothetical protein
MTRLPAPRRDLKNCAESHSAPSAQCRRAGQAISAAQGTPTNGWRCEVTYCARSLTAQAGDRRAAQKEKMITNRLTRRSAASKPKASGNKPLATPASTLSASWATSLEPGRSPSGEKRWTYSSPRRPTRQLNCVASEICARIPSQRGDRPRAGLSETQAADGGNHDRSAGDRIGVNIVPSAEPHGRLGRLPKAIGTGSSRCGLIGSSRPAISLIVIGNTHREGGVSDIRSGPAENSLPPW